jgi:O-antigen/teichoic acid export membrane protein
MLRSRLAGEGLWVLFGQFLSALGLIVGIRLQTEYIPPEVFGSAVLLVGLSALIVGIVCSPFAQGALRFLPKAVEVQQENRFRWMIWKLVSRHVLFGEAVVFVCGAVWVTAYKGEIVLVAALAGLLIVESARTLEMAFNNGLRRQRIYAQWAIAEAWGRPLLSVSFVLLYTPSTWAVLSGYLAASTLSFFLFGLMPLIRSSRARINEKALSAEDRETVKSYSRPLMPLGLVGWINALSDRYIIAGIIGVHQTGVYSAIYGLISRPFLMIQSTLELTLRPIYFHAVSAGERLLSWKIYLRWLALNTIAGALLVVAFISAKELIVTYLLGEKYQQGVGLILYLSAGHLLLITAYNFNSYLYAHQNTKEIFLISALTAGLSVVMVAAFAFQWGVVGAAGACIGYFGTQAAILGWFIWRKERKRFPA